MGFISYDFLIFFLIVISLYWLVPKRRWQNLLLLSSSAVFYGWLVPWHAAVLFGSILMDYFLALAMGRWRSKAGILMWLGVTLNLGLLSFVKYYFTFDHILAGWADWAGLSGDKFFASIILPLGVSFYTLKKIGYLIEARKGVMQPTSDFIAFAAYVSFFPQVLSGPIDRPQKLLKQLEAPRAWMSSHFYNAWHLILMGLFKKIVIANTVKVFVDHIFLMQEPSKIFLIVGGLGFTLQILADFSSYTDLSRGIAFLFGLKTMENFNKPYLAYTPSEFWKRWHISFSSWLRDYIFFPLRRMLLRGRNVPEGISQIVPPLATMFISGLWHGTGLTFIIWGLYYGVLIVLYQRLGIQGDWKPVHPVKRLLAWLLMFSLIVFGWIIFRAQSISWLWNAFVFGPLYHSPQELTAAFVILMMIVFYAALLLARHVIEQYAAEFANLHAFYYTAATLLTLIYMNSSSPDFIYFQF